MTDSNSRGIHPPPFGFSLELWPATSESDPEAWRGRIRHHASGNVRYFQGWSDLISVIEAVLDNKHILPESKPT